MSVVGSVSSKYYSGFNPLDIGNCALWLDAADTSTLTLSGSSVTQWNDKSGNGRNATQSTSIYRPTFVDDGGHRALLFSQASQQYLVGSSLLNSTSNSIFIVYRTLSPALTQYVFFDYKKGTGGTGQNFVQLVIVGNNTSANIFYSESPATSKNSPSVPITTSRLIFGIIDSPTNTTQNFYNTGSLVATSYTNGGISDISTDTFGYTLGALRTTSVSLTNTFDGYIYEVVAFTNELTTIQRQQVEAYLARKWGFLGGGGVQSITTFIPTSISGCGLWLDATDSSTLTFQSGNNVSVWTDKTTGIQAQYSTAAGSVNYPVSGSNINGKNAIFFNQSSLLATTTQSVTTRSYFAVLRIISPNTNPDGNILWPGTTVGGFARGGSINVNSTNITFANQNVANLLNLAYTVGSPLILSITFNNGTVGMWNTGGGTTTSTGQSSSRLGFSGSTDNVIYIGGVGGVYTTSGFLLGELLEYNSALSTTNRQIIEGYLARKWGLVSSLPATHPYALRGLPSTHPYYSIAPVTRAFAPIDIPGCALWLDAGDPTTLTLSGSTVTSWRDKSGTNRTVSFSGTNTYTANTSVNTSNPNSAHFYANVDLRKTAVTYATIFMVHTWAGSALNTQQGLWGADNGGGWNRTQILSFPAVPQYTFGLAYTGSSPQVLAVSGVNTGSRILYSATYAYLIANGTFATVNGVSTSTVTEGAAATQTTSASTNFGATALNTNIGSVNFHEIIIYTSSTSNISTVQRQQVEAYLARKWGLIGGGIQTISTFTPTNVTGCQLWLDAADSNSLAVSFTGSASLNQYVTTSTQNVSYTGTMTSVSNIFGGTCFMNGSAINGGNGRSGFLAPSSSFIGIANFNQYVTTSPQNVSYIGTLTSLSSFTGGTCVMNGAAVNGGNPLGGVLAPSSSNGVWYACSAANNSKVVKMQFALSGTTLTVQGLSAGFSETGGISPSNSGSSNDALYATYAPTTIATSSTSSSYGVSSFSMNFSHLGSSDITQWYAYCIDGTFCKVVKLEFKLTGSTLTVQGIIAGFLGSNYISNSNSGATNDSYFAGYNSTTIATSSSTSSYGVANFTASFTSSTPTSTLSVTQWNDKSGNNRNVTQSTVSPTDKRPTYDSTLRRLNFNGSQQLTAPTAAITDAGQTIILVASHTGTSGRVIQTRNTAQQSSLSLGSGTQDWLIWLTNSGINIAPANIGSSATTMVTLSRNGFANSLQYNVNGGTVLSPALSYSQNTTGPYTPVISIGASPEEGSGLNGYVNEIILYSGALSTTDRQNIEGYLALKWGLQSSLPSTHPYALRGLPSTHPYVYRMPATTAFNPRQISGCALWLDAADPATISLSGTNVTQWNDKSGNGYNLTQSTDSSRPLYDSSANAITFVSNRYLNIPQAAINNANSYALSFVFNPISSSNYIFVKQHDANNTYNVLSMTFATNSAGASTTQSNQFLYWRTSNQGNQATTGVALSLQKQLVTLTFDGGNMTMFVNGSQISTQLSSTFKIANVTNATAFTLGAWLTGAGLAVNNPANFQLHEMIFWNNGLFESQRQQVEGYLAWKWGLIGGTLFLPTSISGLALWLDGADPNGNSNIPANGSTVSTWVDKSGNGRNLTGSGTPTYLSGGGINFNGSSYYINTNLAYNLSTRSVFLVAKVNSYSQYAGLITFIPNPSTGVDQNSITGMSVETASSTAVWFNNYLGGPTPVYSNVLTSTITNTNIYNDNMNGTVGSGFVNGNSITNVTTATTAGTTSGFGVGGRWQGSTPLTYRFTGNIYEILLYNGPLTTIQRQQVEGYLARKWGLTGSLPSTNTYGISYFFPSTHPYKLIQPGFVNSGTFVPTALIFTYAWYGSTNGGGGRNVTSTVQSVYDSGAATITLGNGTFGDPQPGIPKYTWITYTKSGTSYSVGPYGEGTVLTFSSL